MISGVVIGSLLSAILAIIWLGVILDPSWFWIATLGFSVAGCGLSFIILCLLFGYELPNGTITFHFPPEEMKTTITIWYLLLCMCMPVIVWSLIIRPSTLPVGYSLERETLLTWEEWTIIGCHISSLYPVAAVLCFLQPVFSGAVILVAAIIARRIGKIRETKPW